VPVFVFFLLFIVWSYLRTHHQNYSKRLSALHDEDELKQRKNMSFRGRPVRLPHSLSIGPVKLAGPKNCSPGSRETRLLSSENFEKWDSWDRTGTVRYCTVPYPFHLTSLLQPPNKNHPRAAHILIAFTKTKQQDYGNRSIGRNYCIGTTADGPFVAASIVACKQIVVVDASCT
jgi:hypothetical protein